MTTRRDLFGLSLGAGAAAASGAIAAPRQDGGCPPPAEPVWGRGIEGQRKADLGDGRYLNPIMAGDHPDPSILKDGDDYFMTFSSFEAHPGLILWRSRDLVNWTPIGPALTEPLGSIFAVDLCKHDGRFFIYIPVIPTAVSNGLTDATIFVIHADHIEGPWSAPVKLDITSYIDPGHAVGEDGRRYLFLSGVNRVRLSADGLSTDGPVEHVYDGWKYPDDWVVEAFSLEGPKIHRRGDWFYLISAVGGTSGPATGHMVIAARSRSIHGPWENCPHNPIVRTRDPREAWWSRGHGTLVDGPAGDPWMVYHGFENGYRTLGRQTLLEPMAWTDDGWFRALGGDLGSPLPKPRGGGGGPHGRALSDDFSRDRMGVQWTFHAPGRDEARRVRLEAGALVLDAKGKSPADASPLACLVGDRRYEFSVDVELEDGAEAGLLLFFDSALYCGMGVTGERMITWRGGKPAYWREPAPKSRRMRLKIVNDGNIVTQFYSLDGQAWTRHGVRAETSGYNANTVDDLVSLRPALYATGSGRARFRDFTYQALS